MTAGLDLVCGTPPLPTPCHRIITDTPVQTHQVLTNQPDVDVGIWDTNNSALLHTLVPAWTWDPGNPLPQYQLNRVIGTMGSSAPGSTAPILAETRELVNGSWVAKQDAPVGRFFSNAVLLPDKSLLVVGGQDSKAKGGNANTGYYFSADRFFPGQPTGSGAWTTLASTNLVDPNYSTPRGYHSVALLLADGSVILMGGRQHQGMEFPASNSEETVDHFKPPYFFNPPRPVLSNVPPEIHHGQVFQVDFSVKVGREAQKLCLNRSSV